MNRQILACNVGLDISKADFNACILTTYNDYSRINSGSKVFQNSPSGFTVFFSWCNKTVSFENKSFTMEFTGRYSEKIAHFLYEKKSTVFMVSPFKSNRFRESYDADVKTDQTDAYTLAVMGLERKLVAWQPDSEFFANLKIIVRERYGLIKQKTAIKNKLHALAYAAAAVAPTVERLKEQMKLINKQIREIDKQIENYLKTDEKIWQKVENLQTIPGIGLTTISTILVETDGFRKTANVKELTAFAGYKVTIK
jgi:transposase